MCGIWKLFFAIFFFGFVNTTISEIPIQPEVQISGQSIEAKSKKIFKFSNFEKSTWYEVRISHMSIQPSDFFIEIEKRFDEVIDSIDQPSSRITNRKLLDVDKKIFFTGFTEEDDQQNSERDFVILIKVTCVPKSITNLKALENEPIRFNIIVEKLHGWGTVSKTGIKMILVLLIIIIILYPVLKQAVNYILKYEEITVWTRKRK